MNGNTLNFKKPSDAPCWLSELDAHQRQMEQMENDVAELLYRARAMFIGGNCLPFGILSAGKRAEYRLEAKHLIQEMS